MPLTVHRRNGEPCPRCGDRLEAVFYEDYVMCYCPTCQTDGQAAQGPAALAALEVGSSAMLSEGDQAPDFTLPDQNGDPVTLSDLRGKAVVLYFYPKADTPGCTTQACGVRDHRPDYEQAGAVVLGVSPDAPKKIAKFDEKFGLGFPLLGDEDH